MLACDFLPVNTKKEEYRAWYAVQWTRSGTDEFIDESVFQSTKIMMTNSSDGKDTKISAHKSSPKTEEEQELQQQQFHDITLRRAVISDRPFSETAFLY